MPRVCVIGLDSLAPNLVFDAFADHLPNLHGLARNGLAGSLESCVPPITVPAWMAMMTLTLMTAHGPHTTRGNTMSDFMDLSPLSDGDFSSTETLESWLLDKAEAWRDDYQSRYRDDHQEFYRLWRGVWSEEDGARKSERSRFIEIN